jgi:hypothetical protein
LGLHKLNASRFDPDEALEEHVSVATRARQSLQVLPRLAAIASSCVLLPASSSS